MKEMKKEKKTYCSSEDFEKDFFPMLYQEKITLKQGKKVLLGPKLTKDFLENIV